MSWNALADEHRREILELLLDGPRTAGEIVEHVGLSQPGTSKHLRVLREAGLVRVEREGTRRIYAIEPAPLSELHEWLSRYRRLWDDRLDALERHLDTQEER